MALHILANGAITDVRPADGHTYTTEELQRYVGGYLEYIYLDTPGYKGWHMFVNEEGNRLGLPPNNKATEIVWWSDRPIVGDVLLITPEEYELGRMDEDDEDFEFGDENE